MGTFFRRRSLAASLRQQMQLGFELKRHGLVFPVVTRKASYGSCPWACLECAGMRRMSHFHGDGHAGGTALSGRSKPGALRPGPRGGGGDPQPHPAPTAIALQTQYTEGVRARVVFWLPV